MLMTEGENSSYIEQSCFISDRDASNAYSIEWKSWYANDGISNRYSNNWAIIISRINLHFYELGSLQAAIWSCIHRFRSRSINPLPPLMPQMSSATIISALITMKPVHFAFVCSNLHKSVCKPKEFVAANVAVCGHTDICLENCNIIQMHRGRRGATFSRHSAASRSFSREVGSVWDHARLTGSTTSPHAPVTASVTNK